LRPIVSILTIGSAKELFSGAADCREREGDMFFLLCIGPRGCIEVKCFQDLVDRDEYTDTLDRDEYAAIVEINGDFVFDD